MGRRGSIRRRTRKDYPKVQAVIKEIDDEPEPDENQKEESGIVKKLRHFIESILYEEVDEDDDEDDDADDEALENGEDRQEARFMPIKKGTSRQSEGCQCLSKYSDLRHCICHFLWDLLCGHGLFPVWRQDHAGNPCYDESI